MQIVSPASPPPHSPVPFTVRAAPACNYTVATKADISEDVPPLFHGILLGQVIKGGAKKKANWLCEETHIEKRHKLGQSINAVPRPSPTSTPPEGGAKAAFVVLVYYSGSRGCGETYADTTEERRGQPAGGEVTYFCS